MQRGAPSLLTPPNHDRQWIFKTSQKYSIK